MRYRDHVFMSGGQVSVSIHLEDGKYVNNTISRQNTGDISLTGFRCDFKIKHRFAMNY